MYSDISNILVYSRQDTYWHTEKFMKLRIISVYNTLLSLDNFEEISV